MEVPTLKPYYRTKAACIEAAIPKGSVVLDVGFWGQAVHRGSSEWPHAHILARAKEAYGVDLAFDPTKLAHADRYQKASAESFSFDKKFEVVFASELIEHLANPGLFLGRVKGHLSPGGYLVLTTPNAFSLFPLIEKLVRDEPSVNSDHTMYFNKSVLARLLEKCGFEVVAVTYLDSFHPSQGVRRMLRPFLSLITHATPKFLETLVVVARPRSVSS